MLTYRWAYPLSDLLRASVQVGTSALAFRQEVEAGPRLPESESLPGNICGWEEGQADTLCVKVQGKGWQARYTPHHSHFLLWCAICLRSRHHYEISHPFLRGIGPESDHNSNKFYPHMQKKEGKSLLASECLLGFNSFHSRGSCLADLGKVPAASFYPQTYLLPSEYESWKNAFSAGKGIWIWKPCASARGIGIKVVTKSGQVLCYPPHTLPACWSSSKLRSFSM